jgi:hypothetical protein
MASVVDEMMAKEGEIDPDFVGINQARAAGWVWDRERGESEEQFLNRCRRAAAERGYRLIAIAGHLTVGSGGSNARRLQ